MPNTPAMATHENPAVDIAAPVASAMPSYASSATAPVVDRVLSTETDEGKAEEKQDASPSPSESPKVYASEEERDRAERESKLLKGSE